MRNILKIKLFMLAMVVGLSVAPNELTFKLGHPDAQEIANFLTSLFSGYQELAQGALTELRARTPIVLPRTHNTVGPSTIWINGTVQKQGVKRELDMTLGRFLSKLDMTEFMESQHRVNFILGPATDMVPDQNPAPQPPLFVGPRVSIKDLFKLPEGLRNVAIDVREYIKNLSSPDKRTVDQALSFLKTHKKLPMTLEIKYNHGFEVSEPLSEFVAGQNIALGVANILEISIQMDEAERAPAAAAAAWPVPAPAVIHAVPAPVVETPVTLRTRHIVEIQGAMRQALRKQGTAALAELAEKFPNVFVYGRKTSDGSVFNKPLRYFTEERHHFRIKDAELKIDGVTVGNITI